VGELFCRTSADSARQDGIHYYERGITTLREVEDAFELGRALLRAPDVYGSERPAPIREALKEARALLAGQGAIYYQALATYLFARQMFADGDFAAGYHPLCEAREIFQDLGDLSKLRQVEALLKSASSDAVALSLSDANTFAAFGGFAGASGEAGESGDVAKALETLKSRTGASRVLIVSHENDEREVFDTEHLSSTARMEFLSGFNRLLGEEISPDKPSLLLDTARDPYINELLPSDRAVGSVIVAPMRLSGAIVGYAYLDRLVPQGKNALGAPFAQAELNFAVGFADFAALQVAHRHKAQLVEDNRRLKEQMRTKVGFPSIITQNAEMLELLARVRQIVDADISVTITGETGSGKDLLAKAIHYNSGRKDKRFISVNCAALPETLLESELFGYRRGAFTGADRDKPGLLEEAHGGTFFLDEIGDMPLSVQAKLLRALEEKEVVRLGDSTPRRVDVRFISATHKDLHSAMERGDFRQDLYYRLSALSFRIPALRERREDIPLLIQRFSAGSSVEITQEALQALVAYDWPGNVR
ncbi:MAG TPA: sigma 54-interacting transcriptional regulator, partial [candidate division Zixibacteria bacterium]|nr:sigma 54-interacting transcriptional regulator [candidate division Zixibacteria bacterium]